MKTTLHKSFFKILILLAICLYSIDSLSQANISVGTTFSENFNSLGSSQTATLPSNWRVSKSATARETTSFSSASSAVERAGGNSLISSAANGIYRFNANNDTSESSIGGLASGSLSKSVNVYAHLKNNAALPITSFTISYDAEKFRNGSNSAGFSIELLYSTDGTSWISCGSDFISAFSADANSDGFSNSPGLVQSIVNKTFTPANAVVQDQQIYFAWRYSVATGTTTSNAQALGVDNISLTPKSSTTWNGTSWSNGTPTASHDAIIAGDYSTASTAQGTFTAKSLTVNSGVFTLATETSLTVENAVINNAGSNNFIVENNANLIQNNAVANTGAIKVRRNSNPLYRYDYTLWSSPVVGQNLKNFSSATLSGRFYLYNPATGTNGDYEAVFPTQNEASYNFIAGKGYLIRTSDTHPLYVEGNPGTVINAEFTGTPYNQSLNTPLSNANNGFNLVGNPYPSAISISGLFSSNSDAIDGTIWFWRKRNGATGSGYATSTGLGVTSLHPEAAAINTNGVIGAGQGFFVKVKAGATQNTLNFTNTLRSNNTGGSFFRNANAVNSDNTEKHRIWLNLSNGTEIVGQTLLGYMAGATSGIDYAIEGKYFNDSPVAFTSFIENQEFAIQGRSLPFTSDDVVPMSFKTDVAGNYSISIDHADGLFQEGQDVFLKDNQTGQIHNIKTNAYSFASEAGVFNNRFEIAYRAQLSIEVPVISPNNIVVYKQNGSLVVNAGSYTMDKVELYDISGRLVYSRNNIDTASTVIENLSIANQVLVVKITTAENGTANKKIVY